MQKAYANVIYPAVYGKKYEEPVQTSIFDKEDDTLDTEQSDIDTVNDEARTRSQFKPGNQYRFPRRNNSIEGQENLLDNEPSVEDEE